MAAESTVRILFLGDSAQAVRSVSRLEGSFASLGRMAKLGAGAIGVALVGAMVIATKQAIDFQKQMELIHTQAGASTEEVKKMSKAILQMAAAVGTAPEDLAKGLFHIESAGLRGAKALSVLRAAAEGAKVGQADLETVTNALVAAQTSGIKGAGSMSHAMAVLNATVGAGNMRMNDLAAAMGTGILSSARSFGVSLQDVGTAIGTMTVQGQSATQSATRLRMAFSLMAAPTAKATAALKGIGLSQSDLAKTMRSQGLIPALAMLEQHLTHSGLTAVQQSQVIAAAFGGGRTSGGILTLIQNIDSLRKREEQINKTTGDFGEAWVATQKTVDFQMERAKAAIQAAFIPIGTLLLPLVSRLAQGVGDAASLITQHMAQIQKVANLAAQAIGQAWKTYATPAIKEFQKIAGDMGQQVQQAWPQIRSMGESLGRSLGSIFHSVGQVLVALGPLIKALGPEFKIAFELIVIEARVFATVLSLQFRLVSAVLRAIIPVLAALVSGFNTGIGEIVSTVRGFASSVASAFGTVVNAIRKAVNFILHAFHGIPAAIAAAFAVGPILEMIDAIQTMIGWVKTLIGWISKIHIPHIGTPSGGPASSGGTKPGQPRGPKGGRAHGGFIPGPDGAPVPILAHAGEVVLNRAQQQALGGAGAIARMFGFTGDEGPGFADGGIVNRPKHAPHHGGGLNIRYRHATRQATQGMKAVDRINQKEEDLDRAYGQLTRQYQIADGGTLTGTEIDSLIAERNKMLDLLKQEKEALVKAIKELVAAIRAMQARIKAERKKKKPNLTLIGNLQSSISGFQQSITDEKLNLKHQLPFDVRDVQLDIADLKGQTAAAAGPSQADLAALLAEIAKLQQALGIQTAQQAIIGSFAKGTLSVPETGLAFVHAGEQITPRGQVKGGDGGTYGPIQVNLSLSGPLEPLAQFITATVDSPQVADRLSVRIGQRATERARSGRY